MNCYIDTLIEIAVIFNYRLYIIFIVVTPIDHSATFSEYLVVNAGSLESGYWYNVTVHLIDAMNTSFASATYQFQSALAPYGGRCQIEPTTGFPLTLKQLELGLILIRSL